jgi:hypothetical protein
MRRSGIASALIGLLAGGSAAIVLQPSQAEAGCWTPDPCSNCTFSACPENPCSDSSGTGPGCQIVTHVSTGHVYCEVDFNPC